MSRQSLRGWGGMSTSTGLDVDVGVRKDVRTPGPFREGRERLILNGRG